MTPDQLLSQAEEARQAGDQVRARSLINEAITIHLEWAAGRGRRGGGGAAARAVLAQAGDGERL